MKRLRLVLSAFLAAVAFAGLCGRVSAQTPGRPLGYLLKRVGESPYGLWKTEPLRKRLIALLGSREYKSFVGNLDPATDLTQSGNVLYVTGNAPHRGTEEEAVLLVDVEKDSIEVFMLHQSTVVRGWAENDRPVAIPKDVQDTLNRWPKAALVQTLNSMRQSRSR